ncbi:hypothetical protein DEO72_LG3g828 [Vigna unguiculata]|uniref:Transposase n=1 Tax=Vigna unguiculata TaxID=3917 RepID=A0A4D6LCL2_VIGUN|nr:hypothetical protein DEO72_LG3g828 [Vigna unguiculata]
MVLPPLDLEWIVLQYEITNGPILHKSNINNIDMVQSDCHNTQTLLDKISNRLDQEFVGSSFIPASVDSSSYSEVVNLFYGEDNQSRDISKLPSYASARPSKSSQYLEVVKFCQPSLEDAITPISKILDFDNNSDEYENHELEESNWPAKGGYGWVAADVRDQSSLFRWSRLLNSWLNCTPVISKGVSGDIVLLERVSAVDRVCHGQEGATEKFFYMYMCHFSQLHVRLPLDDFTMGVLRALNVAPTQLYPKSWAYLQAFRILCQSLYLEPTPYAFLYFYDTRPRRPATWLSLISRPSISRLDAIFQAFQGWILQSRHMAQSSKKNLALFQTLRKEMAAKAKAAGKADVPNLQESVVEVHVHGGTKRKAELPPRPGKGKDVKKIRAALLGTASGAGSTSREKGPEAGLIELPEISARKDISITLPDTIF